MYLRYINTCIINLIQIRFQEYINKRYITKLIYTIVKNYNNKSIFSFIFKKLLKNIIPKILKHN